MSSTPPVDDAGGRVRRVTTAVRARTDRYARLPLVDFGVRVYRRDREISGTVIGSAIAFRLFLFFVPLLLFVVGIAGFLASAIDPEDFNDEAAITGGLATQIETALSQPTQTRWVATTLGLFGAATAGYSLSKVMVAASALGWRLPDRPKASPRIIGAVVGLMAGIGLIATLINRIRAEAGLGAASFSFVVAFVVYLFAWVVVSMMLPRATGDVAAMLPGAALVALTLTGMQAVSQLFLPDRLSRASALYGAFGATVVTLGWFFLLGRAMVLAIEINAVIHERFGGIANFVFSLPVLRLLPRHSSLVRRIFDLDEVADDGGADVDRPGRPS